MTSSVSAGRVGAQVGGQRKWRTWWRQPRRADMAVCATFAVLALLTAALFAVPHVIWYSYPPGSPMARRVVVVAVTVAVIGTLLLWRRRGHPVLVTAAFAALTVASLLLTGGSGATTIGMALAVYALATSRGGGTTWLATVLGWVVVAVPTWLLLSVSYTDLMGLSWIGLRANLQHPPGAWTWEQWTGTELAPVTSAAVRVTAVVTVAAMLLLAVALGTGVRLRRQREAAQRERERTLRREEQQSALLARATERTHIAREVHDVVAHSVSVMVALADGAGAIATSSPAEARTAMLEVSQTGRAALADMKSVLTALADPAPAPAEGEDLSTIVARFRLAGLPVEARGLEQPIEDATAALATRRIVAESLTNVLRHAASTTWVSVEIRASSAVVEIEVRNGAPEARSTDSLGSERGLAGMRERVAILGGTVSAGPEPDGGWRVMAALPYRSGRSEEART